ncbi:trimethylamine methyltransferase family protein [Eubacterium callanderi]|uniref:trimethylamine methyltransferase family protein n=1 Tax=Eubacterium callanderi TaxID=53442 RepID=UPI001C2D8708|nr:trimethylamine methyltransferase family protein [Eubacterium callanderi]MBV1684109.1 trimethylamine methyltransferase family protein [Eubacterium callanderi]
MDTRYSLKRPVQDLFVDQKDVELMHEMTIKVLKETGFAVDHKDALEVFRKAGAQIDGNIVKIDEKLVNQCLETVPRSFKVIGRGSIVGIGPEYEPAIATGYGPPFVLDHRTNEYRKGTLDDTVNLLKLIETSDVITVSNLSVLDAEGLDMSLENTYTPQQMLMLKYTTRPLCMGAIGLLNIKDKNKRLRDALEENIRIIQEFYGIGYDQVVSIQTVNGISPLQINYDAAENIFGAIQANQAIQTAVLSLPNITSPASVMGTAVHDNIITLAEICLMQLIKPGTPVIRCSLTGATDMRFTAMTVGSPEVLLTAMCTLALGRYYGIPTRVCGSETDAYEPDYQAGAEAFQGLLPLYWGNADYEFHPAGILGAFNIISLEKFILDEEIIRYHQRIRNGITFSAEKSFAETMHKIGPRGNFLQMRTPNDYKKEYLLSNLMHKAGSNLKTRDEKGTLRENAIKKIDQRLAEYQVPETTPEQMKFLNQYLPEGHKYNL